jgi:hypothetical protein
MSSDHVTPPSAFVHCRGCPSALQSPQSGVPHRCPAKYGGTLPPSFLEEIGSFRRRSVSHIFNTSSRFPIPEFIFLIFSISLQLTQFESTNYSAPRSVIHIPFSVRKHIGTITSLIFSSTTITEPPRFYVQAHSSILFVKNPHCLAITWLATSTYLPN